MAHIKVPGNASHISAHGHSFEVEDGFADISSAPPHVVGDLIALAGCVRVTDEEREMSLAAKALAKRPADPAKAPEAPPAGRDDPVPTFGDDRKKADPKKAGRAGA
jgi:hypothetical protein